MAKDVRIPERPQDGIYDPVAMLLSEERRDLWNHLASFWNQTHVNVWFAFLPESQMIEGLAPSEMADQCLEAWRLPGSEVPRSEGDILFFVTQSRDARFQTLIAVSEALKNRFFEGELELVARQEVAMVSSDNRVFPIFTTALIALQNVLVSDIHLEDQSLSGRFRKFYEQWRAAPLSQRIPGGLLIVFMALLFPFALIYGKIRSGGGSGSGGGASGGGGDFGGGGASGKF